MTALVDTTKRFWDLVDVYLPIGAAVFVIVTVALVTIGLRFRSDAEEYPEGTDERPLLEYGYAGIVACIAAFLLYLTFTTMDDERDTVATAANGHPAPPAGALRVDVTATQWAWRFAYPGGFAAEGDERHWTTLVVPVGRPVYFRITSEDVVHSFWIPSRKLKVDAFPLRTTTATLLFPEPGSWHDGGRCNQYCGLNHTTMDFNVRAVPGPEFDRWLAERSQS